MVNGFIIDKNSSKPNCVVFTKAKQHVEPFPKSSIRYTEPGELTHIDLWGKYLIRSINPSILLTTCRQCQEICNCQMYQAEI